ncbi:ATP phosphoribosyltransferase regulatory subunit [Pacificimonas sp. WHA3]|uniref:ATP phosphoribosyltransferase regulatory subunit n=1 Tax=Pacificimonas pallii TaxID=2827236 RepID=A0ABS6SFS1_9SPHN|nr:ATP phosphoribosyltransferase regulatory subunit [Pacificimonas pallii]MBV7257264.1 ATP phosphoribosyltransferase regulatory subunit [Pacificimonas pallii]
MTDPISRGLLPEGFRDRLAPRAAAADRLVRTLCDRITAHGYDLVQPPLAEFEDSLIGRLSDGGAQDLLRVIDPVSQRTLAIRSDITPQAGRIAATRLAHRPRPLRLSYAGPVLSVRPPQVGAERERMQIGAELIGHDSVAAAGEILTVALEALTAAGCADLSVDLTLPSLVEELAEADWPVDNLDAVRAALDGKDHASLIAAGGAAYAPLIEAAGPAASAIPALRAAGMGAAFDRRLDAAEALTARASGLARVTVDPTERRGFEFQTWLGFSLFAGGIASEIGRGGTYIVRHPGGAEEPAIGFSLYIDGLVQAGLGRRKTRRIFLPHGTDAGVGTALRADGWVTVAALSGSDDAEANACTHIWTGEPAAL